MKSIQNQYIALKEGKISQANFMRNVRMSLPQYISNVNSFEDTVKILKNKRILTEDYQDYPGREDQSGIDRTNMFNDALQSELEFHEKSNKGLIDFVNDLEDTEPALYDKIMDTEDVERAAQDFVEAYENAQLAGMIKRGEDELGPDKYKFNDFEGGLSEDKTDDKIDQSELNLLKKLYAKKPTDKIKKMIDDLENKNKSSKSEKLSEAKKKKAKKEEKPYNPNAIHPSELRMGIKVEMEHTDDPKKAEKIALDHLAENPYYYTALKLAGVDSPSKAKAPVAAKKIKKKDATEMTDTANQMQKVKLMKESLEKLVRKVIKEMQGSVGEFSPVGQDSAAYRAKRTTLMNIDELRMEPMWMGQELAKVLPADYTDADLENAINAYLEHFNVPYFKETGFKLKVGTTFYKELKDTIAFHQKPLPTDQKGFNYGSTSHYGGSSW